MSGITRRGALPGLGVALLTTGASALEPGELAGAPVRLDVTETTSLTLERNQRDDRPNDVASRANDQSIAWSNRLHLLAGWRSWRAGLRLDGAVSLEKPDPTTIALELVDERPGGTRGEGAPEYFRAKVNEAGVELSSRHIDWLYPAKYELSYAGRALEVTVGDFYAQLGRGLVLSVRKLDELASDTTIRGARVTGRVDAGPARLRLTALGGTTNPLRIDDASGRYLGVHHPSLRGLAQVTEAGQPRAIATDFVPARDDCQGFGTCTFVPDQIVAGQLEAAFGGVQLGTQASALLRGDGSAAEPGFTPVNQDVVRASERVLTASQSLELSRLGAHGAAYLEAAAQQLDADASGARVLAPGHALTGSLSYAPRSFALLFEGKHYRRFFPLAGNVKLARAREFGQVQYSAPPTATAHWVDTELEGFNTCVSGGRLRGDWHPRRSVNLLAWAGRYHTWAESVTNEACEVRPEYENRVWDLATGLELAGRNRRGRTSVTWGAWLDDRARPIAELGACTDPVSGARVASCTRGLTHAFYRELYARYEALRPLHGPWSLLLQGWHRRRHQLLGGPEDPWLEGEHLTGLDYSSQLSVAFGAEYDTNPSTPDTYFNGQVVYRFTSDSSVSLFAGQRRGSVRCVAGVCRTLPPFEGARLDATVRF